MWASGQPSRLAHMLPASSSTLSLVVRLASSVERSVGAARVLCTVAGCTQGPRILQIAASRQFTAAWTAAPHFGVGHRAVLLFAGCRNAPGVVRPPPDAQRRTRTLPPSPISIRHPRNSRKQNIRHPSSPAGCIGVEVRMKLGTGGKWQRKERLV